jgi:hypothetical protein
MRYRAFLLTAACLIVAFPSAATAQEGGQREPKPKPTRLWNLYPLDPEGGEKGEEGEENANPAPTPSPTPVQTPTPAPEEEDATEPAAEAAADSGGESAEPGGGSAGLIAAAIALAGLVVFAGLLLLRRRETLVASSPVETNLVASAVLPEGEPQQEGAEPRRVVRLQLRDGRVVKGRLKQPLSNDRPVLLIDVVDASDPEGHPSEPEPTDAFVPVAEIEHIEGMEVDEFLIRAINGDRAGRHRSK